MLKILFKFFLLILTNVSGEAISFESMSGFQTPVTWHAVYEQWHDKAVQSHKRFCSKTFSNVGEAYAPFSSDIQLSSSATWVSSLEPLVSSLDGKSVTSDVMTTMVIDLDYHTFDTEVPTKLDIRLATTQVEKDDWISVSSGSTGHSIYSVERYFREVFQDTSGQYELLIAYKDEKPVSALVVFYEGNYSSIYWVGTIPSERRQGFGTSVMINALNRIRRRNIRWVVLQAQPLGEGIYRSLGFIPLGYIARY